MKVVAVCSFNNGGEIIKNSYPRELQEVINVIDLVDADVHKTKTSAEKTMMGQLLYSPPSLNKAFAQAFAPLKWKKYREYCDYGKSP